MRIEGRSIGALMRLVLSLSMLTALHPAHAQSAIVPEAPSAEQAPIAMLVDMTSGQILHARDPDRRFVPASITKTMTVFAAFELVSQGDLTLEQILTLRAESWREWAGKGSTMFLPADAEVSVSDLIAGIANVSANDGSIMLAEGAAGSVDQWLALMNSKAREIGMRNSHFGTPNGWPDEGRTFTTARDLTILAQAMIEQHPDLFRQYVGREQFTFNGITQPNRDPLLGRVIGADGIKTGYTNEAGFGFLGTAQRGERRLVMVVAGMGRNSDRARVARKYMEWGFQAFDRRRLFSKSSVIGEARVQGGSSRRVELVADRDVFVNVPDGGSQSTDARIVYDGPLRAPIEQGQQVATLVVEVEGMSRARIPLLAQQSVKQAGPIARLFNGFMGWFE